MKLLMGTINLVLALDSVMAMILTLITHSAITTVR